MKEDDGASLSGDRAVVPSASSPAVSPVPASIPSAMVLIEVERNAEGEVLICTGCGTVETIRSIKARSKTAFCCCPERKMVRAADFGDHGGRSTSAGCRNCAGDGWVCESHLDTPWLGGNGCCGGAGSPCPVCQPEMANAPLIYSIAQEARRYAAFYPPSSDGRNTFEMFADFVETRSIAQAIEARRAATLGAVHESAVGETDAPDTSPLPGGETT